jgi:hypothetical protein
MISSDVYYIGEMSDDKKIRDSQMKKDKDFSQKIREEM